MLTLSFRGNIPDLVKSVNIAEDISEEDLREIGASCLEGFRSDKQARSAWEEAYAKAMDLALQVTKAKSFPWENCSNVKFPLLTIAAINFHARAYPTLVDGEQVVTYRVFGEDADGSKQMRAARITDHQNYLLLEKTDWEEQTDKALLVVPIMGCAFKKTLYNNNKKCGESKLVLPQDLVVPYYTASLEHCPRASEMFSLSPNAFLSRVRRGQFLDKDYNQNYSTPVASSDALVAARQDAQHTPPQVGKDDWTPTEFIEQHCFLDLDGDGYAEPYVVTFIRETGEVCRILARYSTVDVEKNKAGEVVEITPTHYYTKIPFIPSPDGGFYDLGFGMLLGPLNHACDSLINQMIDAGTMEILGGGFMGRGVKIKRGEQTFAPYEWKTVDSPGVSLKDNIVPLPVRGPSQTLFELMMFLVNYTEKISSANEVQMGELPGSQQKTGAMEIANTNGLKIFAAIYKRIWRAEKEEFNKFYRITALNVSAMGGGAYNSVTGNWFNLTPDDYKLPADGILPAADPNIASKEGAIRQATTVVQLCREIGGQNTRKAVINLYRAMKIPRPEEIFPDPKGPDAIPMQPDYRVIDSQTKAALANAKMQEIQFNHRTAVAKLLNEVELSQATIIKLVAEANKLEAEAKGVAVGHSIALIQSKIAAEKHHSEHLMGMIDLLMQGVKNGEGKGESTGGGVPPVAAAAANASILPLLGGPSGAEQGALGQ